MPGSYSWSEPIKVLTPMTIKELYNRLQPCYKEVYLENGKLYERKFYYGSEE